MTDEAIVNCRVSTKEQENSNSLNRQQSSVAKAAKALNAKIVRTWSGSISSKAGTNVSRKDLKEMQDFCKKNKKVKYLIVDEPDRFMRSIDEAFHFEVEFRLIGVKVWYASDPELNTDDLTAKMLKFMKYFYSRRKQRRTPKEINYWSPKSVERRSVYFPTKTWVYEWSTTRSPHTAPGTV